MALARPANRAASLLQGRDLVRVVCHADGDGLAGAGLLVRALERAGTGYHVSAVDALTRDVLSDLADEGQERTVLVDLEVGDLPVHEAGEKVVAVDHHPLSDGGAPTPAAREDDVVQVQARERVDGCFDACAAAVAGRVAEALDEANADLLPLAVAGAVADRQHVGGLRGLNAEVAAAARDAGVDAPTGLLLHPDAGLVEALAREPAPFLPGLSGRARACRDLVEDAGLDPDRTVGDLDEAGARRLVTGLVLDLLEAGAAPGAADDLVGPRFPVPVEGVRSAHDLAFVLEGAARSGRTGVALAAVLGDASALQEARGLARKIGDRLVQRMVRLEREGLTERGPLRCLEADDPALLPLLVDRVHPTLAGGAPTVGIARSGDRARIEARRGRGRGPDALDLRALLEEAAAGVEGARAGGHPAAAWAEAPGDVGPGLVDDLVEGAGGSP